MCLAGVSAKTKIDFSFTTLYESWFIAMTWLMRLLDRDVVQLQGRRAIDHFAVVRDVDAAGVADEVQDVLEADVVERPVPRLTRGGIQDRRGGRGARLLAELLAGRLGPLGLSPIAKRLLDRGDLGRDAAVARVVLGRQLVFAEGGLELVLLFELTRPIEVIPRRRLHRALERDLVAGIVGIGLRGLPIRGHGLIEISLLGRVLALAERLARRTSAGDHRTRQQYTESS